MKNFLTFWKTVSIKRKRAYSFVFILLLSVLVTVAGTLMPLSEEDAALLSDNVNTILSENDTFASLTSAIFVNNFVLCLLMFIPVFGAMFGVFVLFSTGVGIHALSIVQGLPVSVALLSLMITPIFWIEFVSYSLGMSESIWSFRRFTQRRWAYIAWTALFIGITALLLAVGAIVEAWLILSVGA